MHLRWTVVAAGLCLSALARADSSDGLARARSAYEDGDYAKSSRILQEMFRSADLDSEQLRQAHIYLAASYYYLGDHAKAAAEFDALFRQDPLARVDPVLFPPEIVSLAGRSLQRLEDERDRRAAAKAAAPPPPTPASSPPATLAAAPTPTSASPAAAAAVPPPSGVSAAPRETPPSLGYSFIPFGVGQFANEQYGKGALFLTLEVVGLATFITSSALAESLKSGGVPFISYTSFSSPVQQSEFDTYQTIYIVAFWSTVGIYAVGVVDSLIFRPSQEELDARHGVAALELGRGATLQLVPSGAVLRF